MTSFWDFVQLCFWQSLTWSIFALGYCLKALWRLKIDEAYSMCRADYQAFLDHGPGGTPSTWNGFKRVTLLGWFGRIDILQPPKNALGPGFIDTLDPRPGDRPFVGGIAPQRQLDQRNSHEVFNYLLANLDHFSTEWSPLLRTDTSFLEKNTRAILAHCDCVSMPIFRTFGCEIAHPHHCDGSLHAVLHPEDIGKVIAAGCGERHPLSRANRLWCWWFNTFEKRPPVPEHLCFIYAPRTTLEVSIVMSIIGAGAAFVTSNEFADDHASCPNHRPRGENLVKVRSEWERSLRPYLDLLTSPVFAL